jgi:hypothetical protein
MSPTAVQVHTRKIARARFKALRLNRRVDSPAIVADRLVTYLSATAEAFPVDPSPAYRAYVEAQFSDRFFELCKMTPARWRA